jgi:methyltransferase
MSFSLWILIAVAAQRLGELIYSNRNTKRLLAKGGAEVGKGHYPILISIHTGWIIAMAIMAPPDNRIIWTFLGLYGVVQIGRYWVLHTLGPYWSTRVIDLPNAPLIHQGPYRWIRHPNYVVVVLEIAILPAALQLWEIAIIFSILNAGILIWRIKIENQVLAKRR